MSFTYSEVIDMWGIWSKIKLPYVTGIAQWLNYSIKQD